MYHTISASSIRGNVLKLHKKHTAVPTTVNNLRSTQHPFIPPEKRWPEKSHLSKNTHSSKKVVLKPPDYPPEQLVHSLRASLSAHSAGSGRAKTERRIRRLLPPAGHDVLERVYQVLGRPRLGLLLGLIQRRPTGGGPHRVQVHHGREPVPPAGELRRTRPCAQCQEDARPGIHGGRPGAPLPSGTGWAWPGFRVPGV